MEKMHRERYVGRGTELVSMLSLGVPFSQHLPIFASLEAL